MKRLIIVAALLASAVIAEAQPMPPGKWWRKPEVVQRLELTNDQQDRLDEIFRGAADDLIDAKAAVEKLQVAIRGELDRAQVRRPELQKIARQLSEARGKLFERELMMLVDMRAVLEEEQWRKMRDFLDRRPAAQQQPRRRR
jgi:hypothetical protein